MQLLQRVHVLQSTRKCSNKPNRVIWKQKEKLLCQCIEPRNPTARKSTESAACNSISTQRRRGKRNSSLVGKRHRALNEEEADYICRDVEYEILSTVHSRSEGSNDASLYCVMYSYRLVGLPKDGFLITRRGKTCL